MIKIVKGNKYYFNDDIYNWQGLINNATKLTVKRCTQLKKQFPNDTYFVKVK